MTIRYHYITCGKCAKKKKRCEVGVEFIRASFDTTAGSSGLLINLVCQPHCHFYLLCKYYFQSLYYLFIRSYFVTHKVKGRMPQIFKIRLLPLDINGLHMQLYAGMSVSWDLIPIDVTPSKVTLVHEIRM